MTSNFFLHFLKIKTTAAKIEPLVSEQAEFLSSKQLQLETLQSIVDISEACHQIPQEIKNAGAHIPWQEIQEYCNLSSALDIYTVATQKLPELLLELHKIELQLEKLRRNLLQIKSAMTIVISPAIQLQQMNLDFTEKFFTSIHIRHSKTDDYRLRLQEKYDTIEAIQKRILSALYEKFLVDGTPDFFIFYQDQLAGMFEFHPITKPDQVEIGYWLYEEFRRKGILSQIMPRMIAYAQTHLQVSKIRATTATDNIPSQRLLEKFGFIWTDTIEYQIEGKPQKEFEYFYYL